MKNILGKLIYTKEEYNYNWDKLIEFIESFNGYKGIYFHMFLLPYIINLVYRKNLITYLSFNLFVSYLLFNCINLFLKGWKTMKTNKQKELDLIINTYKTLEINGRGGLRIDPKEVYEDNDFIEKTNKFKELLYKGEINV